MIDYKNEHLYFTLVKMLQLYFRSPIKTPDSETMKLWGKMQIVTFDTMIKLLEVHHQAIESIVDVDEVDASMPPVNMGVIGEKVFPSSV